MNIRSFREGDEASLFAVFFSAVHQIASCDYTREQIDAWAPADMDTTAWGERMRSIRPFVVEIGDGSNASEVVGYGDVQPDGHITHFFVSGAHPRQGIGAMLMRRIHEEARRMGLVRLSADVSKTAEPFFAHQGFAVIERRRPVRRGITLHNALMHKPLQPAPRLADSTRT